MSVEISRIKARQNLREQAREQASDAVFQALDVIPAPEERELAAWVDGGGLTRSPGSSLTAAEQATLTAVRDRVDQAYAAAAPTYHALAVAHASIDSIAADAELTDAEKIAAIESVQL